MVYSNTAAMVQNEHGKSGQFCLLFLHFFETLDDGYEVHFQGFICTPYQRHW